MHYILAHFCGDYLFQNDWMAQNKKNSSFHCLVHVLFYMIPFLLCGLTWWQLLLIAIQHFIQDRTTFINWYMKVVGQTSFSKPPMAPWSIIIVDNIFHILWISIVVNYLPKFI